VVSEEKIKMWKVYDRRRWHTTDEIWWQKLTWPLARWAKNGLDLGENYRNINGCKTFAASIAQTLVNKQVQELENINFRSILSDGSTDVSVTEQEIVYIRYAERSVPVTKMISIEALDKADAQGIFNAIKNALDKLGLNFDKLKPNNDSFPS